MEQLALDLSRYFRSIVKAWPVWLIVAALVSRVWMLERRCRSLERDRNPESGEPE